MTAEEQAVVLVNEVRAEREQEIWKSVGDRRGYGIVLEALCRAIERHEAFRQKVSDAVEIALLDAEDTATIRNNFGQFIIPKPDPLVEVMKEAGWSDRDIYNAETPLRAALDVLGFEIREKNDDQ
jgi:regulator of protease activity HflC (stomatin/prohibitin superfamily)